MLEAQPYEPNVGGRKAWRRPKFTLYEQNFRSDRRVIKRRGEIFGKLKFCVSIYTSRILADVIAHRPQPLAAHKSGVTELSVNPPLNVIST
ncbi:hypothetical protein J6590_051545 [Homalodisca vitripennis]|nr:hypothetical protein J6590_051545 [Homalodisca vitripennis]